jgi:hypothetical protein
VSRGDMDVESDDILCNDNNNKNISAKLRARSFSLDPAGFDIRWIFTGKSRTFILFCWIMNPVDIFNTLKIKYVRNLIFFCWISAPSLHRIIESN